MREELRNFFNTAAIDKQERECFARIIDNPVNNLHEDDIKSGGYVIDSLEASVWCLLCTDDYRDCVLKAVNLGHDTDTTAAIAGGLAALVYGYDNIPSDWISSLRKPHLFEQILKEYALAYK
jgi:ADP-ribosyl-[dinitrogen reductase] hydrolase